MKPCKHNTLIGCLRIIVDHVRQVCDAPEACANYEASGGALEMHPSASGLTGDCGVCGYAVKVGTMELRIHDLEVELAAVKAERDARYTREMIGTILPIGCPYVFQTVDYHNGYVGAMSDVRKALSALDAARGRK